MSVLAHHVAVVPQWRLAVWARRAWSRMGLRHLALALLIKVVTDAIHPLGGIYFPPTDLPGWDTIAYFFQGGWIVSGLFIIFCAFVADAAYEDGVPPLRAYGFAIVALALAGPAMSRLYFVALQSMGAATPHAGNDEGFAQLLWWMQTWLYECGFGLAIYGYWRVTQRAMRQAQAAETERAQHEQRAQMARLLALQSRVEPQLLFDALHRVRALHEADPPAADVLLADLIALLRAMQPSAESDVSTVEREFALVQAWLRVMRSVGREAIQIEPQIAPGAHAIGIAPMLVLPLVRSMLALPGAGACDGRLSAHASGQRLIVALQLLGEPQVDMRVWTGSDVASLQHRIQQLFGQSARLSVTNEPPAATLDLPRIQEEHDDVGADR